MPQNAGQLSKFADKTAVARDAPFAIGQDLACCWMRKWVLLTIAWCVASATFSTLAAGEGAPVSRIRIDGAIGPATADYISRAIKVTEASGAPCLIVELDTPGGLLDSTGKIVQAFYASRVPIVVYVSPAGANAGSAGCFITLAADVAAMAPNSSIGAAHPVQLGGAGGLGGEKKDDSVMEKKLENFAASSIEAIAEKRHRNVEWAISAVRESASITAEKALQLHVIDLIAKDVPDLLRQLDGREINGHPLHVNGARVREVPMLAREHVFQMLWRPEVMFVLMLVAIYGLIGELSNPGAVLPGIAGAIALILVLYMSSILPINIAGIALLILAIALFVIDAFAPSHGILTGGAIISFFLGALLLFEPAGPAFRLSLAMIVPATIVTALFFVFIVGAGLRAQRLKPKTGQEAMVGHTARALTPIDDLGGQVRYEGEIWRARSTTAVEKGQEVEITGLSGLTFQVKPKL
jgi:membrane-bound serine protease (ClpP class)